MAQFHAPSTDFLAYLRGERGGFDSYDPPAAGSRSAAGAIVTLGRRRRTARTRELHSGDRRPRASALRDRDRRRPELRRRAAPARRDVDSFFVLDGKVEFALGDRLVRAGLGTWMSAPPGVQHGFRNPGPNRARMLNVRAPDAGFVDGIRRGGTDEILATDRSIQ